MTVLDRKAREEKEEEVLPYHDAMRRKGSNQQFPGTIVDAEKYVQFILNV